ncbi:MAG: hypothetical protein LBU48_07910 [Coriobacteriales bacterium]|jgi:hypothetical protein|nr:hypothetical protein [Coriobacteriales bacterium]
MKQQSTLSKASKLLALALCLALAVPSLFACANNASTDAASASQSSLATVDAAAQSHAADYLANRVAEFDRTLYVYKDFSDGANNFTQRAWMGSSTENIPQMDEAAPGYSGVSGISAELDFSEHSWGGFLLTNGVLKTGSTDPQVDFGTVDAGLDLTGAQSLSFYAKGETGGERVEFFMGALGWENMVPLAPYPDSCGKVSLGIVELSAQWQRYTIDLAGKDLTRANSGFCWVASHEYNLGRGAIRFALDDIRYEFAEDRLGSVFLQSYASAAPGSEQAIINGFAYLYDNAAAAIALSRAGYHERAQQIADAIVYAVDHDRSYTDGRLRNAYACGDPRSFSGWLSARGEEFARLPGFYDRDQQAWYEDYYAVSTSTGNLAWALLALCEVYEQAPQRSEYLQSAQRIADCVLTLRDQKGGFVGGYEGWEGSEIRLTYKSTEHNIDLIAAFSKLAVLSGESFAQYAEASAWAREFVLSMYDASKACFYTGTGDDGVTINKEVLPLDSNTWAILALGDSFSDGQAVLSFIEQNMRTEGGYDFNTDRDGAWMEGTAQVALAYRQIGDEQNYASVLQRLESYALPDGSITAANHDGLTTGFMVSGTDIPWVYDRRIHVGATAWFALAQLGENPFV